MTSDEVDPESILEEETEEDELVAPDPEAPEADALDQEREVVPGGRRGPVSRAIDAPEADALEQATELPEDLDDDDPA
jgi:hypothetical protein